MALNPYQRRTKKQKSEPLFPRYLFLNATPDQQSLAPLRSTRGVINLVRFGTKLAEVPETVINNIQNKKDPTTGLIMLEPVPVKPGEKVKVFDGPLASLQGIFQEQKGEARAVLLMNMLGRESTIEVDSLLLQRCM